MTAFYRSGDNSAAGRCGMSRRDLTGRAVVARASSRDPLGYVVRSGRGPGGGWGHWILDRTGDPGSTQSLPGFCADWHTKLAVVGDTVCTKDWGACQCPLAHVDKYTRAALRNAVARAGDGAA